jgi:hypothetical protein
MLHTGIKKVIGGGYHCAVNGKRDYKPLKYFKARTFSITMLFLCTRNIGSNKQQTADGVLDGAWLALR